MGCHGPLGRCTSLDGYGQSTEINGVPRFEVANWNNYIDPAFALAIRRINLKLTPTSTSSQEISQIFPEPIPVMALDIVWDPDLVTMIASIQLPLL